MTVKDALTGEVALRRTLVLFGVLCVVGLIVFDGIRTYEGFSLQRRVAVNEEQREALEARVRKYQDNTNIRIKLLESFVFGEITSELDAHRDDDHAAKNARERLDAWILHRDAETRERLRQLELWRLNGQNQE